MKWSSRELDIKSGSSQAAARVEKPGKGYRAYLAEVVLTSSTGDEYKLSTEARVTPTPSNSSSAWLYLFLSIFFKRRVNKSAPTT